MLFKVQLVIEDESISERTIHEVEQVKREALSTDNLGLKLDEVKSLLKGIQTTLTHQQVKEYYQQQ